MLSDSMQTLSKKVSVSLASLGMILMLLTDVVCLVKHHDGIFRHFLRNLLSNLGVEQVVEGIDYDIYEGHLRRSYERTTLDAC